MNFAKCYTKDVTPSINITILPESKYLRDIVHSKYTAIEP